MADPTEPGPILVVEDDPALLAVVCEVLEEEGYPVVRAMDGAAALRAATRQPPALILLDMRLPGLSGWDVARSLAEHDISAPIVVMTAAQDAAAWAAEIGAAGYLAKPFELPALLDMVERLYTRPAG
jgi:CheY-like chemotaxis protein